MEQKTIAAIKLMLTEHHIDENMLRSLRQDTRIGVQKLLNTFDRKKMKERTLLKEQEMKRQFDQQYIENGMLLAGVDEAGRGPLAGPVTAAAVILPEHFSLPGLTDSKQLSESLRNHFYEVIKEAAIAYHIAVIEPEMIDKVNIFEATKLAMKEALRGLVPVPDFALIDAVKLSGMEMKTASVIKGDDQSLTIAAASILAKVKRDKIMRVLDGKYPVYEFANNKGYGTKAHLHALDQHGPSPYHRRSFAPVSSM